MGREGVIYSDGQKITDHDLLKYMYFFKGRRMVSVKTAESASPEESQLFQRFLGPAVIFLKCI